MAYLPKDTMNAEQVGEALGVNASTVYRWLRAGTFPDPKRLSARKVFWTPEQVEQWVSARLQPPAT